MKATVEDLPPNQAPKSPSAVRPRDAASLLIYRRRGAQLEVLMGKRRPGARFLPDVYVFPGGALDKADAHKVVEATAKAAPMQATGAGPSLAAHWVQAMAARHPLHAAALLGAALRESHEESGWRWADAALPSLNNTGFCYLGRAITPARSPRRFHARFFAVPQERMQQDPHADGELLDLRWVDARNPEQLPIIDVTEFMLAELQRELTGKRADVPLLCYVNALVRIRRLSISP
jgi:8-oxo-dGTP pyrophosphatase MutT (NUDIX family)